MPAGGSFQSPPPSHANVLDASSGIFSLVVPCAEALIPQVASPTHSMATAVPDASVREANADIDSSIGQAGVAPHLWERCGLPVVTHSADQKSGLSTCGGGK